MSEESNTYKQKVFCKNCDFRKEIDIKKGTAIGDAECPNCGTL